MASNQPTILLPEAEAILRKFTDYLYARFSLENSTIENYCGTIKRFLAEAGPHPTPAQAESYYGNLRKRKASYSYAGYVAVALERFMEMIGSPTALGRPPVAKRVLKRVLTEAEVTLLIAAAGKDKRDRAMVATLAYSGARNEEFCKLRVEDVDTQNHTIHIAGKGSRDRKACVSGACMQAISDYLADRKPRSDEPLFVTKRRGLPLEQQDIRKFIRALTKRADLKIRIYPHLLRHSIATNLILRGASLLTVRDQLGHQFLESTMGYIHCTREQLRQSYRANQPSYM